MQAPEQPKPNQPTEPICNNPAYYEIFATTEERLAYNARMEQERNEKRFLALQELFDESDRQVDELNKFLDSILK